MKLSDFDYELPDGRIADRPAERRDEARLLVHDVGRDATRHLAVRDLSRLLEPGDLLVVNDTRVVPARLQGRRATGGRVELLFVRPLPDDGGGGDGEVWEALVRPARKLRPGEDLELAGGRLAVRMLERLAAPGGAPHGGSWRVGIPSPPGTGGLLGVLERHGEMPLPPYLRRGPEERASELDRERYQTVYARHPGAVAAPTAGLHFTPELLDGLEARGVELARVTLHVGPGTFLPISSEEVEEHVMHAERFQLSAETVRAVASARARGGRVVAVGTTVVRVLEGVAAERGELAPTAGETALFLRPGSPFRVADALLTNFHLPRSTLLLLVAAFAGRERILRLYREAVDLGYRFYSYGDAMFLHGRGRDVT